MTLGRVVGQVVSTHKRPQFSGATLLLVQPEHPDGTPRGATLLAVDSVGAGIGERVLVVIEGRAASEALGQRGAPVDAAIIGIVDAVTVSEPSPGATRPA
jgi:ethanolamine utilization protein EutN